jgi:hypothetical protein
MRLIAIAAAIEIVAGAIFVASPSLLVRLALNSDLNAAGTAIRHRGQAPLRYAGLWSTMCSPRCFSST